MWDRPDPSQRPRLLLIGIDGADYRIAEWLMGRGYLANLRRLTEEGAWGPARSTIPPLTPAAWTTIMTGKNPGKHGVFDFLPMNGDDPAAPVGTRRRAMTLWQGLSDLGYRVGTFNVPVTYPPEHLSAFQVSGFTAPAFGPAIAYPQSAFEVLSEAARGYEPFGGTEEGLAERELRDRIDLVPVATRRLLDAFPCDVYMANFQIVDWMQHLSLPEEMRPGEVETLSLEGEVARTYQLVDDRIGELIREWASADTYVMVISDHGAAVVDRLVNLEKLFLDEGLMAYTSTAGKPSDVEAGRARARLALRLWHALQRRLPGLARSLYPLTHRLGARLSAYQAEAKVDWSRTLAAPWGLYGQVRLNLQGRDPEGIVPPEEEAALLKRIRGLLLAVEDPVDGQPIYREVHTAAEVYSGPFVGDGPDLVAVPRSERYLTVCGRMFGGPMLPLLDAQTEVAVELDRPRDFHSSLGIFGVAGPGIAPGRPLTGARVRDFAPTALYLLGEPIPEDMDGRPVVTVAHPLTGVPRPVVTGDPWPEVEGLPATVYTPEEQQKLEAQLAALGYL